MIFKRNTFIKIFLFITLIPVISLFIYIYISNKEENLESIKDYETNMAISLLHEEGFINERLNAEKPEVIQSKDDFEKVMVFDNNNIIANILISKHINHLEHFAVGVFSNERKEPVFHIGSKNVYDEILNNYGKLGVTDNQPFFMEVNGESVYVVPIPRGFIYTYQQIQQHISYFNIIIVILLISGLTSFFAARWANRRVKERIKSFKEDIKKLRDKGANLAIKDHGDQFTEIASSVNDLNNHISSEKDLLHTILDSLPLGIIYYDKYGQVIYANNTTTQLTGYEKNEIKKFTVKGNVLKSMEHLFWETLRSGEPFLGFESYCPTKDNREIPVMTSTNVLKDTNNNIIGIISSFIDITEQDRLRRIEYHAQMMLDHISDGVIMVDNDGLINGLNHGAEEMTGLREEEVLGKKYDDIFIKRKTYFTKLTQTLETRKEYTNYKKEFIKEDGEKTYLMITTRILYDKNVRQIGAMGIYKDITQLELLSQQIQRADKLAVIGELAAGTAHEIRNPLTTIKGFIQILKKELVDSNKEDYINLILQEINNINEIIKEMIMLAKPAQTKRTNLYIHKVINDIVHFITPEIVLHDIQINTRLDHTPEVYLDERQIKQVFINLLRNAIQAIEKNGTIEIESIFNPKTEMIEVTFRDNGEGIPNEKIAKVYEPFFTTKSEGIGLGIPVSYQIMKNHGGDINITSMEGKGTNVTLYFPINNTDEFD